MRIENNKNNNITFNKFFSRVPVENKDKGEFILKNIRNIPKLEDGLKGKPPMYLRGAAKMMKGLAGFVEKTVVQPSKKDPTKGKFSVEDLVNVGNVAKELVCMIVYPLQVLSNPDLPKDKRRFIGIYDFCVTVVSLTGTLLFLWKGKAYSKVIAKKMLSKTIKLAEEDSKAQAIARKMNPNNLKNSNENDIAYLRLERAIAGGAFVLGLAGQTILFKRVLAPALAPLMAAKARTKLEENDAKKAKANDKTSSTKNDSSMTIPQKNDTVVSRTNAKWEETMPVNKTTPWLLVAH